MITVKFQGTVLAGDYLMDGLHIAMFHGIEIDVIIQFQEVGRLKHYLASLLDHADPEMLFWNNYQFASMQHVCIEIDQAPCVIPPDLLYWELGPEGWKAVPHIRAM